MSDAALIFLIFFFDFCSEKIKYFFLNRYIFLIYNFSLKLSLTSTDLCLRTMTRMQTMILVSPMAQPITIPSLWSRRKLSEPSENEAVGNKISQYRVISLCLLSNLQCRDLLSNAMKATCTKKNGLICFSIGLFVMYII